MPACACELARNLSVHVPLGVCPCARFRVFVCALSPSLNGLLTACADFVLRRNTSKHDVGICIPVRLGFQMFCADDAITLLKYSDLTDQMPLSQRYGKTIKCPYLEGKVALRTTFKSMGCCLKFQTWV